MIVVVGAGPSGQFVASELHRQGHQVLLVYSSQNHRKIHGKHSDWQESQGLGGRTKLWGGWLDFPSREDRTIQSLPLPYARLKREERKVRAWLKEEELFCDELPKKLGFKAKRKSQKNFQKKPAMKCLSHARVIKLIVEKKTVKGILIFDEKKKQERVIPAKAVYLCASPFGNLPLLQTLPSVPKFLGRGLSNHQVTGQLALCPKDSVRSKKCSYAFKKVKEGVLEWIGPKDGEEISREFKSYYYFQFHYIASMQARSQSIIDLKKSPWKINFKWMEKEKKRIENRRSFLRKELNKLPLKNVSTMEINNPYQLSNIAHESGGALLGKVTDKKGKVKGLKNLFLMDASLLPGPFETYPTLGLLCLLSALLNSGKRGKTEKNA